MKVVIKREKVEVSKADVLIVPVLEETSIQADSPLGHLDDRLEGLVADYLDSGDFSGALNATSLVRTRGTIKVPRVLLVGMGKPSAFTADHLRQASATAAITVRKLGVRTMTILPPDCNLSWPDVGQVMTEGVLLGLYSLKAFKSQTDASDDSDNLKEFQILASEIRAQKALKQGADKGRIIAEAVALARDLGNSPGNEVNPSYLAETAKKIAKQTSLQCKILTKSDMEKMQMGCLLGVAQGSEQPPVLISLDYAPNGTSESPIVLIGKGITFDSGGISIKPAANMEDMKMDMAGGAAVLGTMQALSELGYHRRVVGLVPASENLPSGTAIKPGDILRAMSGKTVEVINTDAEGRLILADALSYAVANLNPTCMIDLATLTGAVVVALGSQASGMMGTDEDMMTRLKEAGERTAERVWQLPLYDEYSKQISSDFADIKNTGGRAAGSIIGGAFLKEFVGDIPWVHLDIAGTAWTHMNEPYIPRGATGVGIRLLLNALEDMPVPTATSGTKARAKATSKSKR